MVNAIMAVICLEHRQTWMRIIEVTLRVEEGKTRPGLGRNAG